MHTYIYIYIYIYILVLGLLGLFRKRTLHLWSNVFSRVHDQRIHAVCCRALQCVAVCCSVLQCIAVYCSVLQCVVVCWRVQSDYLRYPCSVLQSVAVLQCVAACCSRLPCVAVCCRVWKVCSWVHDIFVATTSMGWLRLVGFLKLYAFFAEEPYKRDDILQKRPIILRSLLIVATP